MVTQKQKLILGVIFVVLTVAAATISVLLLTRQSNENPLSVKASLNGTWVRYDAIAMYAVCYYNITVAVFNPATTNLNVSVDVLVYRGFVYNSMVFPPKYADFVFPSVRSMATDTSVQNVSAFFQEPYVPQPCPSPVVSVTSVMWMKA
jgi:hypothetical protein